MCQFMEWLPSTSLLKDGEAENSVGLKMGMNGSVTHISMYSVLYCTSTHMLGLYFFISGLGASHPIQLGNGVFDDE